METKAASIVVILRWSEPRITPGSVSTEPASLRLPIAATRQLGGGAYQKHDEGNPYLPDMPVRSLSYRTFAGLLALSLEYYHIHH